MLWFETATPNLEEAREFSSAIHRGFPRKVLAYNCSPSLNREKKINADEISSFREELSSMGYRFQFITLAGFHVLNHSMFSLARGYTEDGMGAFVRLQKTEFRDEALGYAAV